jgi:uncharacterized iron-regulated protein
MRMMRMLRLFSSISAVAILLVSSLPGTIARACPGPDAFYGLDHQAKRRWASSAHPLTGRVIKDGKLWEPGESRETSCGTGTALSETIRHLTSVLANDADVLLLGEVHDNAEHHWLRARILDHTHDYVAYAGRAGQEPRVLAVVLEQFKAGQGDGLQKYRALGRSLNLDATADEFKLVTQWDQSGWSKYPYDDLLTSIVQRGFATYAGDAPREVMMKAAKDGTAGVSEAERKRLALDTPLGAKLDDASLTEIEGAHCGMVPKEAFGGMAFAQRYRDAHLADATLQATDKHGSAILIAGNGHVRTDRGVPWYIRQRAPSQKVVSVMLVEVEDGKTDPEAYVPRDPDGNPAADYLIFTPRAERSDPCDGMRRKAN